MTMSQRQTRKPALFRPRRAAGIAAVLLALAAQLAQAQEACPSGSETAASPLAVSCITAPSETAALPAADETQDTALPGSTAGWIMASMLLLMAFAGDRLRESQNENLEAEPV